MILQFRQTAEMPMTACRFVPCLWNNVQCHKLIETMAADGSFPLWMAGHHKNAGSWFKAAHFSRSASWWQSPPLGIALFLVLTYLSWRLWKVKLKRSRQHNLQTGCSLPSNAKSA